MNRIGMDIETNLKAHAVVLLLEKITGVKPPLQYHENHVEIILTDFHKQALKEYLRNQMKKTSEPSKIKIDLKPVVVPVMMEKAIPYIAGLLIAGYITGKVF